MTSTRKPAVPYAERLARESVKFGLRVGGSLLRHGPGLFKAGLFGLPLALFGGLASASRASDSGEHDEGVFTTVKSEAGLIYDERGEPHLIPQNEIEDYNKGLI